MWLTSPLPDPSVEAGLGFCTPSPQKNRSSEVPVFWIGVKGSVCCASVLSPLKRYLFGETFLTTLASRAPSLPILYSFIPLALFPVIILCELRVSNDISFSPFSRCSSNICLVSKTWNGLNGQAFAYCLCSWLWSQLGDAQTSLGVWITISDVKPSLQNFVSSIRKR